MKSSSVSRLDVMKRTDEQVIAAALECSGVVQMLFPRGDVLRMRELHEAGSKMGLMYHTLRLDGRWWCVQFERRSATTRPFE